MLYIYKASAGAGKTHKLTGEYLKLLFGKQDAYKNILAVTFTNKATDEMKQRILKELHTLSVPGGKSDYIGEIVSITGKGEEWVRSKAREILISVLHDYTSFRVSTIDRFFQQVMRSFAKELGRMATYNVELDKDSVLVKSVDMMFSDLDKPENRRLLEWLIEYSLDAVDKGSSWNVKREIVKLGGLVFSEEFKLAKERCADSEGLLSMDGVAVLKRNLKGIVDEFGKRLADLCREGAGHISNCGLAPSDFRGGKNSPLNYFRKVLEWNGKGAVPVPSATFYALHGNIEKWYTGKQCPAAVQQAYDGVNGIVGKICGLFDTGYTGYATAVAVYSNVNVLGILNEIYGRVLEYCREKNIILLSESTELLGRIIDGSDTPFVYEKIGAWIDKFMLDEFQDTSSLQWRNFYPLIQNSLAQGGDNLIVGDVKQSIYRWRGSDWKILNGTLEKQFGVHEVVMKSLKENYRSGRNIVEFNNGFFRFCAARVQELYGSGEEDPATIEAVYKDMEQEMPESKKGYEGRVEIDFIEADGEDYARAAMERLCEKIARLHDAGYSYRDMAILVRKGREGNVVAGALKGKYPIISSDSLYISWSRGVQKTVTILRELENPQNGLLDVMRNFYDIPAVDEIEGHSLYQMCENIIRRALDGEEKGDVAFLQAFLDTVLEFEQNNGTNLSQFLKWWDETGVGRTISAPEDMDAIRIITIHKSKGLAYNIVMLPFFTEILEHSPRLAPNLWCSYSDVPVPVKYAKGLLETEFADDYRNERLYKFIDSINTAYVAFTRAKRELVVFTPHPTEKEMEKGDFGKSIGAILYDYCKGNLSEDAVFEKGETEASGMVHEGEERMELGDAFTFVPDDSRTHTVAAGGSIGEGESIREHGIAMHYVFSLVDYASSVPAAVKRAVSEGAASCTEEELLEMVTSKIESVEEYGWFGGEYTVMNECSILTPSGEEKRPDRVLIKDGQAIVIDYKFGAWCPEDTHQLAGYKKQVGRYKELLTCMGYTNVKGYLWYLSAGKVISV